MLDLVEAARTDAETAVCYDLVRSAMETALGAILTGLRYAPVGQLSLAYWVNRPLRRRLTILAIVRLGQPLEPDVAAG
ncbi:hypothetical protein ABZ454_23850 [Streptomyces sp. NPDC005803]|uniref:hypothetical protein n=1 Tax=Streptomyces sp. NPDC005803 TaxID=3154297 RepID=UPI0033DB454D